MYVMSGTMDNLHCGLCLNNCCVSFVRMFMRVVKGGGSVWAEYKAIVVHCLLVRGGDAVVMGLGGEEMIVCPCRCLDGRICCCAIVRWTTVVCRQPS